MTFPINPMTKLDAVNICLSSMGEPTVNSLDGAAVDAQMASDLIDEQTRAVQAIGWHWNRETHTLSPNVAGEIVLPSNTLRVDSINESRSVDVVQRGLKLFNRETTSYIFDKPLTVELYVQLPFEELTFSAKNFITVRSAKLLQSRLLGSETLNKYLQTNEQTAWTVLMQEEADVYDGNMLYDSASTNAIVSRGYFSRGTML